MQRPLFLRRQRGIAALMVTILIALVATVAGIYASRAANAAQQSASNDYQQLLARTASEEGLDRFTKQVTADLTELAKDTPGATVILQAASTSTSSSCAPGSADLPYEFKPSYTDAGNSKVFGAGKYYSATTSPISTTSGVSQAGAWRVRAQISGSGIIVESTGCTGNSGTGNSICQNTATNALTRRVLKVDGLISLGSSAITVGDHVDSRGSIHVTTALPTDPKPKCAVTYGDSYSYLGAPSLSCQTPPCDPLANAGLKTKLFEQIFGSSKATVEAAADRTISGGCTNSIISGLQDDEVVWINGDVSNCTFSGSSKAIIIVNGDIKAGPLIATGLVYANNVYQDGSVEVLGSVVVENAWDKGAIGENFPKDYHFYPNHANDAAAGALFSDGVANPTYGAAPTNQSLAYTHSAAGTIKVNYKPFSFKSPTPPGTKSSLGTWIDF